MSFDVTYFHEIYSREIDKKCLLKYFNIKPSDMKFTVRKIPELHMIMDIIMSV